MYMQIQGVAMGSRLGPLLANIFVCELENTIVPTLANDVDMWTRYVDDTFAFMNAKIHWNIPSIQFAYEKENNSISFLDVLVKRDNENGGNKGDNIISRMKKNVSNGIAAMPTGNKQKNWE